MAARADSMAAIDAALQKQTLAPEADETPELDAAAPHPAPGVDASQLLSDQKKLSLTADEKRAYDVARTERQDQERQAQAELQAQQEEANAFERIAQSTTQAISSIWKGAQVRLSGLPTPGSLMLPLIVWLILFFLLVPVNGHTRFTWLWLTLTNNAAIQPGASSSDTSASTPAAPDTSAITQQATSLTQATLPAIPALPRQMTGVENA